MPPADDHADHPTEVPITVDTPREHRPTRSRRRGAVGIVALLAAVTVAIAGVVMWWSDGDDTVPGNRRWALVDRFDAEPSALTPVFDIGIDEERTRVAGNDGCQRVVVELDLDDDRDDDLVVIAIEDVTAPTACDIPTATPFTFRVGDRMTDPRIDGGRMTVYRDGMPSAIFAAVNSLPLATEDDVVGTWLLDDLRTVEFRRERFGDRIDLVYEPIRRCPGDDPAFRWQLVDGQLRVVTDLAVTADDCASGLTDPAELAVDLALRRLLRDGATAYVDDGRPVLVGPDTAVTLRPVPDAVETTAPINVAAGTAFGIAPGVGVSADEVIAAVGPELGDPTFDTGWLDVPPGGLVPCTETDDEYRELWWRDLSFALWQRGGRTFLERWQLGPPSDTPTMFGVPAFERPDTSPSGLRTEAGLGVGDATDQLAGANVSRTDISSGDEGDPSTEMIIVGSADGSGSYLAVDGRIARVEAIAFTC